jgi:EmrB/QacA subfamily drug resistance transporter
MPSRWTLFSFALSMLLSSLGVSIANAALPTLAKVFGASFSDAQWIILAYLLTITVVIVSVGRLGDILGRRAVLLTGISLFTVASLGCGLAPSLSILIAARALQGLGGAVLVTLTVALVSETVPKKNIGRTMGLLGTMSAVGTALGPSLGSFLIVGFSWRAIFLIMVPLGMLNFALVYFRLPIRNHGKTDLRSFDALGTVSLGLMLVSYSLVMTIRGGHFGPLSIALSVTSFVAGGFFVWIEARVASPLIRLSTLKNPGLSASLIMNTIVSTVMMSTLVIGPFYLSRALGLNQAMVGIVMSVGPCMSILSGVPAGRMVDRFGAPLVTIIGLIELVVGTLALSVLPSLIGLAGYIVSVAILSPGYQLFLAANSTLVMTDVDSDQRGVISGLLNLSRNLGLITGASLMGAIFVLASDVTQITTADPRAVATGMRMTFYVATVLAVIALSIAIKIRSHLNNKNLI